MPITVILSDSRGVNLGYLLSNISQDEFKSFSFPGATLTELIFRSAEFIRRFKPKLVLILGGINDMTILDRATRKLYREYPGIIFSFDGITGMDLYGTTVYKHGLKTKY